MFEVEGGGEGSVLAYEAIMAQMFERKSCWESYIWYFWNVWEFKVHLFSMSLRGGTRSERRRFEEEPGILDFLFISERK